MRALFLCLFLTLSQSLFSQENAAPVVKNEITFSIIKPSAIRAHQIGSIIDQIERTGLTVIAIKMSQLNETKAKDFYREHDGKPFFADLVKTMSSGPIVALVVQGDDSMKRLRQIVGTTDPAKAEPFTIRAMYGKSVSENAIHASDSASSAAREIPFFFTEEEIYKQQ